MKKEKAELPKSGRHIGEVVVGTLEGRLSSLNLHLRKERSSFEDADQGMECVDAIFGGCGDIGSDGGECARSLEAPEASGDLCLDLDHADILLSLIVSKWDRDIPEEADCLRLQLLEPQGKVEGILAGFPRGHVGVLIEGLSKYLVIASSEEDDVHRGDHFLPFTPRLVMEVPHFQEEGLHSLRPGLPLPVLDKILQLPEEVDPAGVVAAGQISEVGAPAVVRGVAFEEREYTSGIGAFLASSPVDVLERKERSAGAMQPVELAEASDASLVEMRDGGSYDHAQDGVPPGLQPIGALEEELDHCARREMHARDGLHQGGATLDRDHVAMDDVHRKSLDARSILDGRVDSLGKDSGCHFEAERAFRHLDEMLFDVDWRRRRDVENLTTLAVDNLAPFEASPAMDTVAGGVEYDVGRSVALPEVGARMSRLPARLFATLPPKALGLRRTLLVAVGRRRLGARIAVLLKPRLKLRDLDAKSSVVSSQKGVLGFEGGVVPQDLVKPSFQKQYPAHQFFHGQYN